ncbi:MAG: hypothetical protein WD095_00220 [Candidatus Paceibacterota bacterium]
MAIQIEQERSSANWVGILLTLIIVGSIFGGAYYLFFTSPNLINVVIPGSADDLTEISQIEFNAEALLNSDNFRQLRQYDSGINPPPPGKSNPFQKNFR